MKRTLIVILILCFVIFIPSCNSKEDHKEIVVLENGFVLDGGSDVLHKTEYPQWSEENTRPHKDNAVASKKKTVTFNGIEYSGTYENSYTEVFCDYHTDFYKCENGSSFAVNRNTGEVCAFEKSADESGEVKVLTEEELKACADSFASKYINTSDYELSTEKSENKSVYIYTKILGGIVTAELMCICVNNQSGEIVKFNSRMLNRFSKEYIGRKSDELNELLQSAPVLADQKLKEVFAESRFPIIEFDKSKRTLCIMHDGQLSIVYSVDVKLRTENTDSFSRVDFLYIIVKYQSA